MPACVSGYVLNLDSAPERWLAMQSQIARLGWRATHRRYAAQGASAAEAREFGLRSAGELGLWRTTKALLLMWLSQEPKPGSVLHVLEDDAVLQPAFPNLIQPFQACELGLDILFTEVLLSQQLFACFQQLEQHRQKHDLSLLLIDGRKYLACTSSYLLTPSGARTILKKMDQMEALGALLPLDLAYRQWIQSADLSAAISLPFFSTIQFANDSSVQDGLDSKIALGKRADLALRRGLYFQAWDRSSSPSVLVELAGLLEKQLTPEQQLVCVNTILTHGRASGWIGNY